jgi:hypothetical protein
LNDYGEIDLGTAATERACDAITLENRARRFAGDA